MMRLPRSGLFLSSVVGILLALHPSPALADDKEPPPLFTATLRDILDGWVTDSAGAKGPLVLNRLQIAATFAGDRIGLQGTSVHVQVFNFAGSSLSERTRDIQTIDAIEAVPMTRLFEAWIEKRFGSEERNVAIRAGLLDVNADFDSITTANWLVNSSHGIGADFAKSGLNGPSIYPVSSPGVRVSWTPDKHWTARLAILDGVPGIPDQPRLFVGEKFAPGDGVLTIGQADYRWSEAGRVAIGLWRYSHARPALDDGRLLHDQGLYVEVESALPGSKHWSGWLRYGIAAGAVQPVDGYLGAGLIGKGLFKDRPDDRLGLAIARASISREATETNGLPHVETTFEASYQFKVSEIFAVQPDAQFVRHPATVADAPDAFVMGLRLIVSLGGPKPAPATDASDTTVPSDTPETKDAGSKGS